VKLQKKWALEAIQKIQSGSSFIDVLPYIAIVLTFACAFFFIAAYKFGRNESVNNVV
jgi:ABC-2 type transport system permease protein